MAYLLRVKPCAYPGCPFTTTKRYCRLHRHLNKDTRPDATKRGYNRAWKTASKAYLQAHPICVICGRPAEVTDHKIAHKGDMRLFWDRANWQPLCGVCNRRKAVKHEGSFGNQAKSKQAPITIHKAYRLS